MTSPTDIRKLLEAIDAKQSKTLLEGKQEVQSYLDDLGMDISDLEIDITNLDEVKDLYRSHIEDFLHSNEDGTLSYDHIVDEFINDPTVYCAYEYWKDTPEGKGIKASYQMASKSEEVVQSGDQDDIEEYFSSVYNWADDTFGFDDDAEYDNDAPHKVSQADIDQNKSWSDQSNEYRQNNLKKQWSSVLGDFEDKIASIDRPNITGDEIKEAFRSNWWKDVVKEYASAGWTEADVLAKVLRMIDNAANAQDQETRISFIKMAKDKIKWLTQG